MGCDSTNEVIKEEMFPGGTVTVEGKKPPEPKAEVRTITVGEWARITLLPDSGFVNVFVRGADRPDGEPFSLHHLDAMIFALTEARDALVDQA